MSSAIPRPGSRRFALGAPLAFHIRQDVGEEVVGAERLSAGVLTAFRSASRVSWGTAWVVRIPVAACQELVDLVEYLVP